MKSAALLLTACLGIAASACTRAQSQNIRLNAPNMDRSVTMMQAFQDRKSTREFSERELSLQDLSDLLWAAWGYNRPADKKRTAPTAMNRQEIDIYVVTKNGVYLYDAGIPELKKISDENILDIVSNQPFAAAAPLHLVIVSDMNRYGNMDAASMATTAIDAGIVSQNISLFCAGAGLATVPRGGLDKAKLAEALNLNDKQILQLSHPVGYMRQEAD